MKKVMPVVLGTVALTAFTSTSYAASPYSTSTGLYLGGNYGYLKIDGDDEFDDSNDVWQGIIGYQVNQFFALEGAYSDFGKYGGSVANAETTGYSAALKGILPLTDQIEFFAKAGQLWYDTDYSVAGVKGSSDDEGLFAGAGFNYKLSEQILLNAQYTWYDLDVNAKQAANNIEDTDFDTNLNQASVGVEYRF